MGRRKQAAEEPPEAEERSALAGAVVVVLLLAVVFGVLFAWSEAAGILGVVIASTGATWWSVTRRKGTDQPLPSPTEASPPEGELPGQGPITVTHREGMSIYVRDDGETPARAHVRVVHHQQDV